METDRSDSSDVTHGEDKIVAHRVAAELRPGTLPRHFGDRMMIFENAVYDFMQTFAPDYRGGFWQFYELNNRGFYMAPDRGSFRFYVFSNDYEGQMSADAAGITACLFAYSHLSFEYVNDDLFGRHFHWLRDFAEEHAEAAEIFAAID